MYRYFDFSYNVLLCSLLVCGCQPAYSLAQRSFFVNLHPLKLKLFSLHRHSRWVFAKYPSASLRCVLPSTKNVRSRKRTFYNLLTNIERTKAYSDCVDFSR